MATTTQATSLKTPTTKKKVANTPPPADTAKLEAQIATLTDQVATLTDQVTNLNAAIKSDAKDTSSTATGAPNVVGVERRVNNIAKFLHRKYGDAQMEELNVFIS